MMDALIGGIANGAVYSMLAVGFVLIYASTGIANFAQGSLSMGGAFIGFVAATRWGFPVWAAALAGIAASVILSYLMFTIGLRPLNKTDHLFKGIATLAIDIILVNVARMIFGPTENTVPSPLSGSIALGGLSLPASYAAVFIAAIATAVLLQIFLKYTLLGTAIRSVTQNPEAAALMGVNLPAISTLSWVIAGIIAGLAGILLSPITNVAYNMMDPYLVRMFAAASLGGLSSIWGAVIGGLILGALEGVLGTGLPASSIDVVSVIVLMGVLIFRPQGLFGVVRVRRI